MCVDTIDFSFKYTNSLNYVSYYGSQYVRHLLGTNNVIAALSWTRVMRVSNILKKYEKDDSTFSTLAILRNEMIYSAIRLHKYLSMLRLSWVDEFGFS